MYTEDAAAPKSRNTLIANGPARDKLAPAQTPFEFAENALQNIRRLNSELEALRGRLFGDDGELSPPQPAEPARRPLQDTISNLHWEINKAGEQVDAIHKRL
jgi:hypothetical protein